MSVRLTIEARDTAHARAILEAIERVDASTLGYVSKAALVGQAYGQPFPALPAALLATESATGSGSPPGTPRRRRGRSDSGLVPARVFPLAVAGQWPAETALGSPEATSGPPGDDSGGRFGTAQRARLHALLDEAGRAVDDGDEAGLRRLLGAALDDAASLTLTPAARAR